MTHMPETIWADTYSGKTDAGYWHEENPVMIGVKYRRDDLPPRVKPLVWEVAWSRLQADCAVGRYIISDRKPLHFSVWFSDIDGEEHLICSLADECSDAKAAAQVDYTARIISELEGEA